MQSQKETLNTNPPHPSKLRDSKKGSGNPIERNKLQVNPEMQSDQDNADNADKIVTAQSDYDVNGNDLEKNLRNGPAH